MAQLHFFKVPYDFLQSEVDEVRQMIEAGLAKLGRPDDKVLVTNFDYQGSAEVEAD